MKAIRIAALAVVFGFGIASTASAQGEGQGQGVARGKMGGLLLQGIVLTDAQKEQQKAIREKYATQLMEIRKNTQTSGRPMDDAAKAKWAKLNADQAAEIRAILTAEQQVIFDRNVAEMRARMAEKLEREK